jgi:hypothetical protein
MQASTLYEPLVGFKGGDEVEQDLAHFSPTDSSGGVAMTFVCRQVRVIISELIIRVCHAANWLWQAVMSARMRIGSNMI